MSRERLCLFKGAVLAVFVAVVTVVAKQLTDTLWWFLALIELRLNI